MIWWLLACFTCFGFGMLVGGLIFTSMEDYPWDDEM